MSEQASQNVSVEQNGRVLTGGPGTSMEALEQAIERTAPEPTTEAETKATPASDEPKATRGRERFSELTHQREEANKRAHEANERAIALADRLERLEKQTAQAGKQEPPEASQPPPVSAPSVSTSGKPSEDEVGTTYKTYGEYVEALTDWKSEQREAAVAQQREHTARGERWNQTRETARVQYPDFDQMIASGPGADIDIGAQRMQYLLDTPGGEHVIYRLAKDADAARRVAGMSDFDFGILFKGLVPSEQPAAPPQRASKAPAPYVPVNGGGRTAAKSSADAAKAGNFDEFRIARAAERGVKPKYR